MGIVSMVKSVALTSTSVLAAVLGVTLVVDQRRLTRMRARGGPNVVGGGEPGG